MTLRVVFMGTPEFAVPSFEALRAAGHEVVCAYTRPPRPAGRGGRVRPSPVQRAAEAAGIAARAPERLADPLPPGLDAVVVAAYGAILPAHMLAAPRLGCLNVHASLLPRWRGAAPIQRAIMAGDAETGVTIMRMDSGLDTGPTLLRRAVPIGAGDDAGALRDRLAALGAELVVAALAGDFPAVPQPAAGATWARRLEPADEDVDWRRPAVEIARRVRALAPRPGARFAVDGEAWKLLAAEPAPGAGAPGEALDNALTVACGEGALRALRVQRPGRKPMDARAALRGRPVPAGARLR